MSKNNKPAKCSAKDDFSLDDLVDEIMGPFPEAFQRDKNHSPMLFQPSHLKQSKRLSSEQNSAAFRPFLQEKPYKTLVPITNQIKELNALKQQFPNFSEVIAYFQGQIAICQHAGTSLAVPPINLQGEPGIGKTLFVKALAEALNTEFFDLHVGGMHAEFELVGGNSMFSKATAGALATTLIIKAKTYSPVVLLDEICLLKNGTNENLYHPLYSILDTEQARSFRDQFLDIDIDVSNALYITTTNNLEQVPAAIRSRVNNFHVTAPSLEQNLVIVPNIFKHLLEQLKLSDRVSNTLPRHSLFALAERPPREIKKALHRAVGCALLRAEENIELCDADFAHIIDLGEHHVSEHDLLH
ncbi:hypothetical protein CWE15_02730 [Aliidiomarina taiwanensis]|uniref:ATPase AAA-type core domain-containing protein n=1 Tax=Aliidiomarina taiwanensis TaxID=946228 RepID=A0A432X9K4_9GAMM|nr:AAA family ATPase [Aliidiomarina taiwanensis]RUO44103.1 hypothetical protein CWE15_02730 [Aliidiomarina taiwanensis]